MRKRNQKNELVKTKYGSFVCTFEPEMDMGGYVTEAEKVQGAVSWGKNLAEAKRMIKEAIEGIVEAQAVAEAERKGIVNIVNKSVASFA